MEPSLTLMLMLLEHWKENEDASANADFMRLWWLPQSERATLAEVKQALTDLETKKAIVKAISPSIGEQHYGRNPEKTDEDLDQIARELREAESN